MRLRTSSLILTAPFIILALAIRADAAAADKAKKPEPGSEIKLERVPAMTPAQSLASIEVAAGYRIEAVATEPRVIDPIASWFDEFGRMYVVEIPNYSEKNKAF